MKALAFVVAFFMVSVSSSLAQTSNASAASDGTSDGAHFSISRLSPKASKPKSETGKIISKAHISYKSPNVVLTTLEEQITDLESRECEALLKRDNVVLMGIWDKDFTLATKQDALVQNANALPYYSNLSRLIEKFTRVDSVTVYTSGIESSQQIKETSQTEPQQSQKFFHEWTFKDGLWKLTTKRKE